MAVSHHQNAGQNHNLLSDNKCSENAVQSKYLETTATNPNCIQEEIKDIIFGNACYY
jgi:hypothetical protein